MCVCNWLSGVRPGSRVPLSQAISDTGCIMSGRNQLAAAGSCGESMILNRNQDKLNLTLSLASPSCRGVLVGARELLSLGGGAGSSSAREERGHQRSCPSCPGHLLPHVHGAPCKPPGVVAAPKETQRLPPETLLTATVTLLPSLAHLSTTTTREATGHAHGHQR